MKKMINLILALFFPVLIFAGNPFKGTEAIVRPAFIYQKQDVQFPSCHASTLVETPEGMLTSWFGGTEERAPDVSIYTSLNKNGKWGKPVMAADGIHEGKQYPC